MKCTKLLLSAEIKFFSPFCDATTAACSRSIMILVNLQHKSQRQRSWNALLAVDKNCKRECERDGERVYPLSFQNYL